MAKVDSKGWIKPGDPMISDQWRLLIGNTSQTIVKRKLDKGSFAASLLDTGPESNLPPAQPGTLRREE